MSGHDHHDHAGHDHHGHDHHDHDHDGHAHASAATPTRRLVIALSLTASFMTVEVVAGFVTHSLALLSDAGHMLTDAGALIIAILAQRIAARERSRQKTFGFRRAEVLAALANGVVLGASSVWIVIEAIRRFTAPPEVQGLPMMVVAVIGLVINLISARVLLGGGASNANVRAAAAHVAADAAGSVAAIIAGLLVWGLGWNVADPIISIVISVIVIWSAWKLVRDAVDVLMEGVPRGLSVEKIEATIASTSGVASVHDLHVWSVSDGLPMISVHVVLQPDHHGTEVARQVVERVRAEHEVQHVTVQPEAAGARDVVVQLKLPK
ncbi:MAG: cation diffusion facilitator family transporter [Archangium sp.]